MTVAVMAVMTCMIVATVSTVAMVVMIPRWGMFLINCGMRRGVGNGLTVGVSLQVMGMSTVLIVLLTVVRVGIHDSPYRLPRIGVGDGLVGHRCGNEALPGPFMSQEYRRHVADGGGQRQQVVTGMAIGTPLRARRVESSFPTHDIPLGGILVGVKGKTHPSDEYRRFQPQTQVC